MNRRQFILVLAALAVIGSAGLVLLNHNKQSWAVHEAKVGDKVLPNFRFNDVAAIHIKASSDLNVEHKNGLWRVKERGDYPANFHQIKDLLIKIRDLKVAQSETVGPSQLAGVELDKPGKADGGGMLLEFKDAEGKVLDSLLVGKRHMRHRNESVVIDLKGLFDGRYILLPSDPQNVLLVSDELTGATPEPEMWLSRDFFKIENIQLISRFSTNADNSWELLRESESWPWTLVASRPGEVLKTNFASQAAQMLGFLTFVDVVPNAAPSTTGLDKPMVMTVLTFDHFTYTLKIGAKRPDGNFYMAVSVVANIPDNNEKKESDDEFQKKTKRLRDKLANEQALAPWVYLVDSPMIERLMCDRAQILEKKTTVDEQSAVTNKAPLAVSQ